MKTLTFTNYFIDIIISCYRNLFLYFRYLSNRIRNGEYIVLKLYIEIIHNYKLYIQNIYIDKYQCKRIKHERRNIYRCCLYGAFILVLIFDFMRSWYEEEMNGECVSSLSVSCSPISQI